uniref:Nucleoprotein n=1 Tax=Kasokero virus TaxID=1712570 RepID=A0A7S6KTP5_9VIRU|nr:nucleoprotein [Kasokero virus]QNS29849.1 nucleoprotein [Kasokero virus]QNS29850.1 nucleoprotein [Kasokero virus]QNS29851.1 nucleoprotein [Kasokero virus]QNS29852.1 nucleoprotein [Kasokero virus]
MSELSFKDVNGLNSWYEEFKKEIPIYTAGANSACLSPDLVDLSQFKMDIDSQTSENAKNAVYGRAVIAATRKLAPIYECAWTSCEGIFERSMTWFNNNSDKPEFKVWHDKYNDLKSNLPEAEQILAYQTCSGSWRKEIGYEINQNTSTLKGDIVEEYGVNKNIVGTVKNMLVDMVNKRKKRLGGVVVTGAGTSEDHITWMENWLDSEIEPFSIPGWGSWAKQNSKGTRLAGTAIANITQKKDSDALEKAKEKLEKMKKTVSDAAALESEGMSEDAAKKMCQEIEASIGEAETLLGASVTQGESKYQQQAAAMDIPFSAHYWAWRSKVNENSFPALSQWLFELGQRPIGAAKVNTMLGELPFIWARNLRGSFASSNFNGNKIYMHPAVLTAGRLSDMAACFGAFPVANPSRAIEGTGNTRYLLNLKREGDNPCASMVTSLFDVFSAGFKYQDMDIVPPEHMLHQSFLGKTSPFQTASKIKGSFTKINVVAAPNKPTPYSFTPTVIRKPKEKKVKK